MKIKHKIASFMRKKMENSWVYRLLVKINLCVFHYEKREHKRKFGNKNSDKVFYVIRGCGKEAGLFALYIGVINEIYNCYKKNWIPVVDFNCDRTQYNVDFPVRGHIWNAWEYYFQQPTGWTLEEVYQSKNVILSGWTLFHKSNSKTVIWNSDKITESNEITKVHNFIKMGGGQLQEVIENMISEEKERVFGRRRNILGVSVRGTDYIAFKPKGHRVQPPYEDVIAKTKEFLEKYPEIDGVFLTTEDQTIFSEFEKEFGSLIIVSNSNRISNYKGDSYITTDLRNNNRYEQGLEYLIEKSLLAECKYLVSTRAAGADYALVKNNNQYTDKYIFDLGKY